MALKFTNKEKTQVDFTDSDGVVWSGLRSTQANGKTIILGDGQIPELAQAELKAGGVIAKFVESPRGFKKLARPAFLFMADELGLSEAAIEALIGQMPATSPAETKAKKLALFVFRNQQWFERSNGLLGKLVVLSSLTDTQVDAAWWGAEDLKW